jgi:large subunit ribosomal protein L17
MRHGNHKFKLGIDPAHRKSLMRNLSCEIIDHKKIKTTHARCKAVKSYLEKLVTLAKNDTVANRRQAFRKLNSKTAVKALFEEVAPKFKDRNGGYTRIMKLPDGRVGDGAKMSFIAFVD